MFPLFIDIGLLDILDILFVAFLLYQIYLLIRGTVAVNIFIGLFLVYLLWLLVRALNMELLGSILGQFIGLGVLALIIVFQQEIRRFLLMIGSKYPLRKKIFSKGSFFSSIKFEETQIKEIMKACSNMRKTKTGALLIITKQSELNEFIETGMKLDARISSQLLEAIFFKKSPLHDGAVIISDNKIKAAKCILPITGAAEIPSHFGLRHRAALGLSEASDAHVVVISEETGNISYVMEGEIKYNIAMEELNLFLKDDFTSFKMESHHS